MLIDAHIHIGRENSAWAVRTPEELFREYTSRGIGGVRDGGDNHRTGLRAREAAKKAGIVFKTPVIAITRHGGYGGFLGEEAAGTDEIRELFPAFLDLKPDYTKAVCSGILLDDVYGHMLPGGLEQDELDLLTALSHDHGLKVMAHCVGTEGVEKALNAGVDSIEHGNYATEEQLFRMKEQGVYWVPTIATYANELYRNAEYPEEMKKVLARYVDDQMALLNRGAAIGVKIALGSDAGPEFTDHGAALLDEIDCFVQAGIPREEAVRMCEENGQALLDWERVL